jgi:hypothetical protein
VNAAAKIRAAMRANEREILKSARRRPVGELWQPASRAWWNALKRLEARGLLRYDSRAGAYLYVSPRERRAP